MTTALAPMKLYSPKVTPQMIYEDIQREFGEQFVPLDPRENRIAPLVRNAAEKAGYRKWTKEEFAKGPIGG